MPTSAWRAADAGRRLPARRAVPALAWLLAWAPVLGAGPLPQGEARTIENCAGGPPLQIAAADNRAVLDDDDRRQLSAAMRLRFPVLAADDFTPAQIVLWQKAPNEWLYVSLALRREAPDAPCFTATFVAAVFDASPDLLRKYFFAKPAPT
jgi:hypothetical protein